MYGKNWGFIDKYTIKNMRKKRKSINYYNYCLLIYSKDNILLFHFKQQDYIFFLTNQFMK